MAQVVRTFSDGSPATLGTLLAWSQTLFGPRAVAFVEAKIAESPRGADEVVIADEGQVLMALASMMEPKTGTGPPPAIIDRKYS